MPLECSSRPETLKKLVITPEFVSKNCCFADFAIKTLFLWFHPKICWNLRIFLGWRSFFGLHPRIPKNSHIFGDEYLFFLGFYSRICEISRCRLLFFGPHSWIRSIKLFVPPQNLFMPPPPSRYSGARPAQLCTPDDNKQVWNMLIAYYCGKLLIWCHIWSPCLVMLAQCGRAKWSASVILVENPLSGDLVVRLWSE